MDDLNCIAEFTAEEIYTDKDFLKIHFILLPPQPLQSNDASVEICRSSCT